MRRKSKKIGVDYNGHTWYWDPDYMRIWCQGDDTSRDQRGYDCCSVTEAKQMLRDGKVP
jgi:hypothetical protein